MEGYKERLKEEYKDLKERTRKLKVIVSKYHLGKLEFDLNCSIGLLETQLHIMEAYLAVLKERLEIEVVNEI